MNTIEKISAYLKPGSYAKKHADQIESILKNVTADPTILAAGYLHDVLEDTDVTLVELTQLVGSRIAGLVWEVTKTGPSELKNLKTKDGYMIKFADRLSNISNLPFGRYIENGIQGYLDKSVFWKK
jgi:(p)ppGpp synthase/HD superfamily hydrolase